MNVELNHDKIRSSYSLTYDIKTKIPDGLQLMDYQKVAVHWLTSQNSILLADDQGLGKTIESIAAINLINPKKILIICPSIAKLNWKRELEIWLTKKYSIWVSNQNKPKFDRDIWIINYRSVHKYKKEINLSVWDLLILDEAQNIVNPKTRFTKMIVGNKKDKIPKINAIRKWAISGTPMMNKPIDLWTILSFLDPIEWNSWWYYANRYCLLTKTNFGTDVSGASNIVELQNILRGTIMLRRLKEQALKQLPAKIHQQVVISAHLAKYSFAKEKPMANEIKRMLDEMNMNTITVNNIDKFMKTIRTFLSVNFTDMPIVRKENGLAKVPIAIEMIKQDIFEEKKEKLVIMAHHRDVVNGIYQAFPDIAVKLQGGMSMKEKEIAQDKFQNDKNIKLIVCSIRAAGTAINLQASHDIIFVEQDWVPSINLQATDRCHRLGQLDTVLIRYLVIEDSIDYYIMKTMLDKKLISNKILDKQNPNIIDIDKY